MKRRDAKTQSFILEKAKLAKHKSEKPVLFAFFKR